MLSKVRGPLTLSMGWENLVGATYLVAEGTGAPTNFSETTQFNKSIFGVD